MSEKERIEQLATQVTLLIQFAATMIDDIDLLERTSENLSSLSESTLTLAPLLTAAGADYEEAHMEAEVKRKRASAITNLVRVLKETENERSEFKKSQLSKQDLMDTFKKMGIV